jgi:hypothetical protein
MGRRSRVEREDRIVMRIYESQLCPWHFIRIVSNLIGQCRDPGEVGRHVVNFLYTPANDIIKTKTQSHTVKDCKGQDLEF